MSLSRPIVLVLAIGLGAAAYVLPASVAFASGGHAKIVRPPAEPPPAPHRPPPPTTPAPGNPGCGNHPPPPLPAPARTASRR